MEKVAKPIRECSVLENKSSSGNDVVRLKKMMSCHRRQINLGRPFDGGGCGPYSGGTTEAVGHAYGDDVSSSSRLAGENFATNSQSFDIFAAYSATPFKSPGKFPLNSVSEFFGGKRGV